MTRNDSYLPFEVEIELLDSLHASSKSLVAGNFGIAVAALVCGYASHNRILLGLAVLMIVAAVIRYRTSSAYRRFNDEFSLAQLHYWKSWTILTAAGFSSALGMSGFIGVSQVANSSVNIPLVGAIIGYAASNASRNAGVPECVKMQLALAMGPLALAYLMAGSLANFGIACALLAAMVAMNDISRSVHDTLVRALMFGRDKLILAEQLSEQAANFNAALCNMSHGLAMFDANDRLVICNARFAAFFSLDDQSSAKGVSTRQIIGGAARADLIASAMVEAIDVEFCSRTRRQISEDMILPLRDGRILELSFQSMANGGAVVIVENATERRAQEAKIAHMARFDRLTGLPNRAQFEEKFAETLERSTYANQPFAVICIDLDHFKEVNDTLTHMVGDQLLVAVAKRLGACVRSSDSLARFGGDEFIVILSALDPRTAVAEVSEFLQGLINCINEPYEIDSQLIVIGMSAGVAIAPTDGGARDEILRAADLALYKAKQLGRGTFHFFEAGLDAQAQERRQLTLDMRSGMALGQFFLEYQPIVAIETGRIASCEALLRWRHPTRQISPDKFIAVAEDAGLIAELGRWALNQACRDAVAWPEPVKVAVNLSPVQFKRDDLPATIAKALGDSGLDPSRLMLEITENLVISGDATTKRAVADIIGLGCSLALDDFGRGYSTFGYLIDFPFKKVKLDKSFIDGLESQPAHRAIIRAVCQLASGLSMSIVAEGVETPGQLAILAAENVHFAQGWLFSKSVATTEIPWRKFERDESSRERAA
jgi:diguanylate cyclase (GGDEF)-like protein